MNTSAEIKTRFRFTFGQLLSLTSAFSLIFATSLVSLSLANFFVSVFVGAFCGHIIADLRGIIPGIVAALFWSCVFSVAPLGVEVMDNGVNLFSNSMRISTDTSLEVDVLYFAWSILNVATSALGGFMGAKALEH